MLLLIKQILPHIDRVLHSIFLLSPIVRRIIYVSRRLKLLILRLCLLIALPELSNELTHLADVFVLVVGD